MNEINQLKETINTAQELLNKIEKRHTTPELKIDSLINCYDMDDYLARAIQQHLTAIHSINRQDIIDCAVHLLDVLHKNKKIFICGNGGSAADAQHIAAEFVVKFNKIRPALAAIALTTDTSILTACGNDFSFEDIFSRQIAALGSEGDLLIAISTSGTSRNVLKAVAMAASKNIFTIGITGNVGFDLKNDFVDVQYKMFSDVTARIQEAYMTFLHLVCDVVDQSIQENKQSE